MSKITILYDGIDLSDFMDGITGIKRGIGSGWTSTMQAQSQGSDFLYNVRGSKTIVIDFFIKGAIPRIAQVREKLAAAINKNQPVPLILGDEPNKIWYAVPEDKQELSDEPENPNGTLTFLVPSGCAVSSFSKILNSANSGGENGTITKNPDNSFDILINNKGTLPAFPTLKFTHKSDNAYIGIAGVDKVMALGSQEQHLVSTVTTETTKVESQWLLNPSGISQKNNFDGHFMTANDVPNPQNGRLLTGGNLVWKQDGLRFQDGGPLPPIEVALNLKNKVIADADAKYTKAIADANAAHNRHDSPTTKEQYDAAVREATNEKNNAINEANATFDKDTYMMLGAMQQWAVPADSVGDVGSANFTSTFNIWGQATQMGQTGLLQVLFVDGNNKLVAGMGIYKDDTRGNSFQTQLYIGGNHPRTWKTFGPGLQELNNGGHGDGRVPNPNLYFNSATGYFTIQKKGPVFNFTFGNRGGNYPITIPELAYTKCMKVYVYGGQLRDRNNTNQKITNLSLRSFNFQKNDVTKIIDSTKDATRYIPADDHHFGNHEIVVVDMEAAAIYRREGKTIANDEMIKGGEFFPIPVGQSKLTFVFGDNAIPPDIEVTIQERFL